MEKRLNGKKANWKKSYSRKRGRVNISLNWDDKKEMRWEEKGMELKEREREKLTFQCEKYFLKKCVGNDK